MTTDTTAALFLARSAPSASTLSGETSEVAFFGSSCLDLRSGLPAHAVSINQVAGSYWTNAHPSVFLSRNMTATTVAASGAVVRLQGSINLEGCQIAPLGDLANGTVAAFTCAQTAWETVAEQPTPDPPLSTAARFARALEEWKGMLAPHHYDAMSRHIERLLSDEEELEDDGIVPSASSFDDLTAFLASHPWARSPAAGLNKFGQFSVSWSRGRPMREDVTLTFLGDGSVKWYIYRAGKRRAESAAGRAERMDLSRILSAFGCDERMAG